jgi:hypothetical protein
MGYYITIKSDLLEAKHVESMGLSVWLYLWMIDKMTVIDQKTGTGKIWGGKPICYEDVKADLGISRATYKRWLNMLRSGGYIETLRTPTGLVITVNKAFKIFGQPTTKVMGQKRAISGSDVSHRRVIYEPSNIRQYKDNTKTIGNVIEKEDFRGKESPAKERIREWMKSR